jgi:hypothetical protein
LNFKALVHYGPGSRTTATLRQKVTRAGGSHAAGLVHEGDGVGATLGRGATSVAVLAWGIAPDAATAPIVAAWVACSREHTDLGSPASRRAPLPLDPNRCDKRRVRSAQQLDTDLCIGGSCATTNPSKAASLLTLQLLCFSTQSKRRSCDHQCRYY